MSVVAFDDFLNECQDGLRKVLTANDKLKETFVRKCFEQCTNEFEETVLTERLKETVDEYLKEKGMGE